MLRFGLTLEDWEIEALQAEGEVDFNFRMFPGNQVVFTTNNKRALAMCLDVVLDFGEITALEALGEPLEAVSWTDILRANLGITIN